MSLALKDCVDPWKAADQVLHIQEIVPLASLDRLNRALADNAGQLDVDLQFQRSEDRQPLLVAHLRTTLQLLCQRCLKNMEFPVDYSFSLLFKRAHRSSSVIEDEEKPEHDIYEVENDRLCLKDIVEDELLLLLPQVAMHSQPACEINTEYGDGQLSQTATEKPSPFAILAELKKDKSD